MVSLLILICPMLHSHSLTEVHYSSIWLKHCFNTAIRKALCIIIRSCIIPNDFALWRFIAQDPFAVCAALHQNQGPLGVLLFRIPWVLVAVVLLLLLLLRLLLFFPLFPKLVEAQAVSAAGKIRFN